MHRLQATIFGIILLFAIGATVTPAFAASQAATAGPQIVTLVNQDRVGAGLSALTEDPRLTLIAEARAQYMVLHGFFSHCSGGEADTSCPLSGYDFVARELSAGIDLQLPGTTTAENLALNNYPAATAAAQTNTAWLNSPEHKANIMDSRVTYTGVAAACCFVGSVGGQQVTAADNAWIYVQEFSGGPGAVPPTVTTETATASLPVATLPGISPITGDACQYILGFATLHSLDAADIGGCLNDQHFAPNGDAQQTTANGLMAWRKADNWTAFTNGYRTWINGPAGLVSRLNTQRFGWEANPDGLPLAP